MARRGKSRDKNRILIGRALLAGKFTELKRRHVERALRETNAFLDSVIENIPHMIFVKDAKELRFIRFNRAGEKLVGYSRRRMIGKNDFDFFPPAEAEFFTRNDREVLKSGRLFDIPEEPIHTKKRGIRFLHTKKIPILNEAGKPAYLLGISEDITDRLNLQREVAAIRDREQKRIGQDLHDGLGQHLTGVAFLMKGLSKQLARKKLPEAAEANRIATMLNQAISTTRNLARVLNPIDLETGSLGAALKQIASNTERLFAIKCNYVPTVELNLKNDEAVHLYRIAQEAVDNAVKHGNASQIFIRTRKAGNRFELLIEDDGVGFRRKPHHTGMGISNMTFRARSIGGTLSVAKRKGAGTLVTCSFPERTG